MHLFHMKRHSRGDVVAPATLHQRRKRTIVPMTSFLSKSVSRMFRSNKDESSDNESCAGAFLGDVSTASIVSSVHQKQKQRHYKTKDTFELSRKRGASESTYVPHSSFDIFCASREDQEMDFAVESLHRDESAVTYEPTDSASGE
mmetsp:Transcript_9881/g.22108  ORF Transcript_9881/g.22108 Transcript_9881/m.22108 type:complete len:145 (+) Transcript_9881:139-573(+)